MDLTLLLGIIAVAISALSLIVSFLYNRWALKNAKVALEKSDEHTLAQITYESRKQVLWKLAKIIEINKGYYDLKKNLNEFLKTSDSMLIPPDVTSEIFYQLSKMDDVDKEDPECPPDPEPTPEEEDKLIEREYERLENMTPQEKFARLFENELHSAKSNMMGAISRQLNFPITPNTFKSDKKAKKE